MTDNRTLLPFVRKFVENDLNAAAGILESMPEKQAASALKSLPVPAGSPGCNTPANQLCSCTAKRCR